jgi:hypothetical protein
MWPLAFFDYATVTNHSMVFLLLCVLFCSPSFTHFFLDWVVNVATCFL